MNTPGFPAGEGPVGTVLRSSRRRMRVSPSVRAAQPLAQCQESRSTDNSRTQGISPPVVAFPAVGATSGVDRERVIEPSRSASADSRCLGSECAEVRAPPSPDAIDLAVERPRPGTQCRCPARPVGPPRFDAHGLRAGLRTGFDRPTNSSSTLSFDPHQAQRSVIPISRLDASMPPSTRRSRPVT